MRTVGSRIQYRVSSQPSGEALKRVATLQEQARTLAGARNTGIRVGVYRFTTHADANAHADAAQARVLAQHARGN